MSFITFNNLLRFEQGIKDVLIQKFGDIASIIGSTTLNTTSQDLKGAINETHDVPLDIQELYKPLIAPLSVSLTGFVEGSYLLYGEFYDDLRVFVKVSKTTGMSGTTALGTLPSGYRPTVSRELTAYDTDGNIIADVRVRIFSDGVVLVIGDVDANVIVMASYSPSNPQSGEITKNDIEKLIAENGAVIEKNPNWPNRETTGSATGWRWKKYADGTVEAWYRNQHSVAITTAYEDHFRGEATVAFPFYISGYPVVVASAFTSTDGSGWQTWNAGYALTNTDTHISFVLQFYSGSSTTRATAICAHVTGRWK